MNYIKLAERALKILHRSLPELGMGNDVLFVPPVEHILRCFIFEPDFRTKGAVWFWRVVMPLYRPPTYIILNYADRLLGGEKISVLEPDLPQTIDRLVRVVRPGEFDYLNGIRTPHDFLQKIDWSRLPSSPNYRLDLALTHYLTGNVSACQEILESVVCAKLSPRWARNVGVAQEIVEELKADPSALARRIEAWEAINIRWFRVESRRGRKARVAD
jgi:hypothetical protein